MAAKITTAIAKQNAEIIRDAVAALLKLELDNQAILNAVSPALNDPDLVCTVYAERIVPISDDQSINIMLSGVDYSDHIAISSRCNATFFIEIYTKHLTVGTDSGDKLSAIKNHRIAGVIRSILMSPHYKALGVTTGYVEHREVSKYSRAVPRNEGDAENYVMTVMELQVRFQQAVAPETSGIALDQNITSVKISDTNIGLEYTYDKI